LVTNTGKGAKEETLKSLDKWLKGEENQNTEEKNRGLTAI
jgi:hypothetical protein